MDIGQRNPAGAVTAAQPGDVIKDSTTAGFAKDVIEASRSAPVIVDFWAPWCGPCKQLTPIIEKVVKSYGGKVRLVVLPTVSQCSCRSCCCGGAATPAMCICCGVSLHVWSMRQHGDMISQSRWRAQRRSVSTM